MNSRNLLSLIATFVVTASFASAHLITPDGILASGNDSVATVKAHLGLGADDDLKLLYKLEFGEVKDGILKPYEQEGIASLFGNFTITGNWNDQTSSRTISWDLTGTGFRLSAVVWKGSSSYLWSEVHGTQEVVGGPHTIDTDVISKGPAISHISFYGVPDGGTTIALLGTVLIGLVFFARRRRSRI